MTWHPGALLTLETERFCVRSITREDVGEALLDWLADPEVMMGLNLPRRRLSRLQAVQYALSHDNRTRFMLVIETKATSALIGVFYIWVDPQQKSAETGVVLGDRAWWGQGVVTEVRSEVLSFLFDTMGLARVAGRTHGRNISSIFNYQALGFTCEGVLRGHYHPVEGLAVGDARLDQLVFGLLAEEWRQR